MDDVAWYRRHDYFIMGTDEVLTACLYEVHISGYCNS
jgi:hypothetical protein